MIHEIRPFRSLLISLLLPLMLLTFSDTALAELVGRLTRVEGAVDILPNGQLPAVAARQGGAVQKGDFIRTKSNARAEITFNDGSVVKIAQRSRIDVGEYSASGRKLALPRGKVQAVVVPAAAGSAPHSFEIRTPNAIAGVRGTSFYVYHQGNVTGVAVIEGVVHTASLARPSQGVILVAGTGTTVTKRNAPTPPRPVSETELNSHQNDVTPASTEGAETQGAAAGSGGETAGESSGSTESSGTASSTTSTTSTTEATAPSNDGTTTSPMPDSGPIPKDPDFTAPPLTVPDQGPTLISDPLIVPVDAPDIVIPPTDPNPFVEPPPEEPPPEEPPPTEPPPTEPPPTEPPPTEPPPTEPPPVEPLFSGQLPAALMSRDASIDPDSSLLTIVSDSGFAPILSGTTSLWTGSAEATLSGTYPALPLQQPNHYWFGKFYSNSTASDTTADGGAYYGYFGGMSLDDTGVIDTSLSALYIDPAGKIGIMHGAVPGTVTAGVVTGSGTLTLTELNASSGLDPALFPASWWNPGGTTVVEVTGPALTELAAANGFQNDRFATEGYLLDADFNLTSQMFNRGDVLKLGYLGADPSFGIWTRESFGSYNGSDSQFVLISNAEWGTLNPDNTFTVDDAVNVVSLGDWQSGGALSGTADGVWGNLNSGSIRLLTGSLTGSSNLGTSTFGAVSTGSFIDPTRFLSNLTLAAELGFPTLKGADSFTLSGSSAAGSVTVGSVDFYSRNVDDPVSLWIANVSGSYVSGLQQQRFSLMDGATPGGSTIMGNMRITSVSPVGGSDTWLGSIDAMGETGLGTSFRSQFDGIAAGTFTGTTFTGTAAGLSHPVTYFNTINGGLTRFYNGGIASYGNIDGIMAGMSLWGSTPEFTSEFRGIGFFTPNQALIDNDFVMNVPIRSQDLPSGLAMTADGGAYQGHLVAGVSAAGGGPGNPGISGFINALSIDPAGNAGVLRGKFSGFIDSATNVWMADGALFPITLLPTAGGVTAATLNGTGGVITVSTPFTSSGTFFSGTPSPFNWALDSYTRSYIASSPDWGIGQFGLYTGYSAAPAANDPWNIDFIIADDFPSPVLLIGTMAGDSWDPTSGSLRAGARAGWHDMLPLKPTEKPMTGIFIGETVGTFNPGSLQAMTSGIWMETGKFLELVVSNPAALQKLNIPAVEVGRADFTGGNGDFDVSVNNLRFFAPVNGGRPQVFATDSISGNFFVAPPTGAATLTQVPGGVATSGISPTFSMNQWDATNNKWSATLSYDGANGVVAGNSNIQFMGVAAGISSGGSTGTFTGTAAGVVR